MKRLVLSLLCSLSVLAASGAYGQVRTALNPQSGQFTINEGSSKTFTLTVTSSSLVTFNLSSSSSDVTFSPSSLSFPASPSTVTRTITVTAAEDDDSSDESESISFIPSSGGSGISPFQYPIAVADNDDPGFDVASTFTVKEGTTKTLAVALATPPKGWRVVVSLTKKSGSSDMSFSPSSMVFSASNWNTPQNVTVRTVDDPDAVDDIATITLTGSEADYEGVSTDVKIVIDDKHTAQVIVGDLNHANGLILNEGGQSESITVRLSTWPVGGNVTVDVVTYIRELSFSPSRLTFSSSNYQTPQTVEVTALEEDDGVQGGGPVLLAASGADYGQARTYFQTYINDNDTVGLTISPSSLVLAESGDEKTFSVKLKTQPAIGNVKDVTVNLTLPTTLGHVSMSPSSLTFTSSNWSSAQTVTLSAGSDLNGNPEFGTIGLSATGADRYSEYNGITGSMDTHVTDDDPRKFIISARVGHFKYNSLSMAEGGEATLDLKLSAQPVGGNVIVNLSAESGSDVTFSPSSLTFTSSNWDTAQVFTVSAAEDDDGNQDESTLSILAKGGDYNNFTHSSNIYISDNDRPNIVRVPTGDVTIEEGESVTFSISLSAAPSENQTIIHNISQLGGKMIRPNGESNSFTFTPQNWNTPQTTTYLALWDRDDQNYQTRMVTTFFGEPADYDTITVAENDEQNPLVFSSDELDITEGGSATFTVKLGSKPLDEPNTTPENRNVTVSLIKAGSSDVEISPTTLTFTSSNWDTAQTVTVDTSEDADTIDDAANISFTAVGTYFGNAAISDGVKVSVLDKRLVLSHSSLTIGEGESKNFSVKLSQRPNGNVTVGLLPSYRQGSVSPASLTFTPSNWDSAQTVTVSIAEDDDGAEGSFNINIAAFGANYAGVTSSVKINATDNDDLGLKVASTLSVTEGSDSALAVSLTAQPTGGDVSVIVVRGDGSADVTFSPASLTFSGSNWNTPQTITVSAAEDDDAQADSLSISLGASGGNYNNIGAGVKINVTENDNPGLITDPSSDLGLTEGADKTFSVRLAAEPTGDVTITLTSSGSSDVTLSPTSLTFEPWQWSTPKPVTASAAEDDDGSSDSASISLAASGADYADITGSLDVTVTDNDSPGLTLSTRKLTIDEGAGGDFTVRLAIEPSGNVSVSLTISGSDDVTLSPATLAFTPSNWSTTRVVTVNATQDADANDDSASISLAASGADYDNVSGSLAVEVSDDESHELILDPSTLGLTEGGSDDLTVKLSAEPTGNVTVNATQSGSDDVGVSTDELSFTSGNWNTPQVVSVSTTEDDDGFNDSASLSFVASGADFDKVSSSVQVNVTDNDTPGLTLVPSGSLKVAEGGDESFTVRLAIQPDSPVRVELSQSGSDDLLISPTIVNFLANTWDSPKKIEVTAYEDDDAVSDIANITLTAYGANYGGITGSLQIQTIENDTRGLTISPSTLGLTEGDDGTFTVRLNTQPTADVTVGLVASGSADVSLSPSSLTFTASDWSIPKTVTAAAADDNNVEEDVVNVSLTASGAGYGSVSGSLKVTITDNGSPGLTLSSASLTIDEGDEESFTVTLATQPTQAVTLELTSNDNPDVSVDTDPLANGRQNTLTFTRSNWDSAQTVTVSVAEDNDGAADAGSIALNASGGEYGVVSGSVQISITDNDEPELIVAPRDLGVTEGGNGTFSVKLNAQPTGGDVTIDLTRSGSTDITLSPSSLTFTRSDWSTQQTVTVAAAEDSDGISESTDVSLSASGADFDGVTDSVDISITDNDTPGLILSHLTLPVPEGGSGLLAMSLAVQPSGNVTIDLTTSGSEDVRASPTSLTFTSADWNTPKTVTVSAAEDDDIAMDTAIVSLVASGADYEGLTGTVQVDVSDNDTRGLNINPSALGLTEGEDGIFVVKLNSKPSWNVSVAVTASGSDDITISPSILAFDTTNWNTVQTVTVSAAEDDDLDNDAATVFLVASGADYTDITGSMQVSVTDNDTPGLTVSPNSLSMVEGDTGEFTVMLAVRPSTDITLELVSSNPGVTLSSSSLTFTPSDWSTDRTVTISAAEDDDFDDDPATVSLTASGAEYEGIVGNLSVWVVDNDIPQITLSATTLTVVEGSDNTFTARLKNRPIDEDTTLDLTVSGSPDITLSPERLIFTVSNWDRDQTVTVSAAEDEDEEGESGTISLAGTLNGERIFGNVQVSVTDSNSEATSPPVTVTHELSFPSTSWLELDEGSSATFTVRGSEEPPESVMITLSGSGSTDVTFDTDPRTDGNQNTLTITPDDWNVDRTVSVSASEDDDAVSDRANVSFHGTATDFVITGSMPVEVSDNDTPGLEALPAALTIDESSSAVFAVRLDTQPLGNVILTFDNGDSDTALSPSNLIFTPSNWRRARNVTVNGVPDVDDTDDDPADITISAKGGGYDGLVTRVQVRVDEAERGAIPITDIPGFTITGAPVEVDEGSTNDFYLRLLNRPTADVTVTLDVTGESVTLDTNSLADGNQNTLTFSPSNFNGSRMVSVSAHEDDNTTDEVERLSFSATGGNYEGLKAAASVSVDDNDSPSLITSQPMSAGFAEPRMKFTVNLSVFPSAPVRVAISLPSSVAGMTLDTDIATPGNQGTLSFTPSDFKTPQSVYLTVSDDFQSRGVNITLLADGGNYTGVSDIMTVMMSDIDTILGRGGDDYSDRGDPRYWWPVQTLALAIPPPSVVDQAMISIGCRQQSECEVFLVCNAQTDGTSFRGGLPEPIPAWGIARLSASDITDITGAMRSGTGRLGCALHSEDRVTAQVWTRSGDGVLVNNSAYIPSVDIEGVHRADIESIPGPDEVDLSNIRIRCRAPYPQDCTSTTIACFEDDGIGYYGDLGIIERHTVKHLQTSELADIIGHRWSGAELSCELRSDAPFTAQILTRTGGGGALVNNNAVGSLSF
ncbi:beta strand repeat-containing protein [Thioalkalivibrio sp. HK1]|uniref:beta strand repeat-containing protein n=1 Tax=Thioalkalivibrio sp. HK1 TaxID=1469245 RepID=UPI0004708D83|nr:hypothetical protein [Thioalkalivibrio sp. HK1]